MSDSYVTSQATLKCSCGDKSAKLTVYPDRTVFLTGKPMANISDHKSMYNIAPFGKCRTTSYPPTGSATAANHGVLTPMPCVPGTVSEWMNGKNDYIVKGHPALLKSSVCRCQWGGIITITDDGQVDTGDADLSQYDRETEEEWNEKEQEELIQDENALLDGIQMALDIAGLIPAAGVIPDLINAAIYAVRGDTVNAGMSLLAAVPGIGDAATAAKLANKGVKYAKAAKKAEKVKNVADSTKKSNVTDFTKFKAEKVQKAIDNSSNVSRFPSEKVSNNNVSKVEGFDKKDNVRYMENYERKVEKQANGPDKVTITKKTDTIVDSINNNRRVIPITPSSKSGTSTSYGAGQNGSSSKKTNGNNWKENRIKLLKDKLNRGVITKSELDELSRYSNNSIFNN